MSVAGYNAHIADGKENAEDQYSSVDQQKTNVPETSVDETIKRPMRLEQCQLVIRQLPDQGKGRNFLLAGQSCERHETKYSLGCNRMHCGVQRAGAAEKQECAAVVARGPPHAY